MSRYDLRLPWTKPPISANDRHHWRAKAAIVADIRKAVRGLIAFREFDVAWPVNADHIHVYLDYYPRDRRRRDPDNLVVPLFKALVDGLVDTHVVPDDTPQYVTRHMPVIHEPDGDPRLVLVVTTG